MKARLIAVFLSTLAALFLAGCWDAKDIANLTVVTLVGVDKNEDGVRLLLEYRPHHGQSKQTEQSSPTSELVIGEGANLMDAQASYHTRNPDDLYQGAVRALVFSESYAQAGIEEYLNRIGSIREYRKNVNVFTTTADIDDLFDAEALNVQSVGFNIEHMAGQLDFNGMDYNAKISHIVENSRVLNTGYILDNLDIVENKIQRTGYSVFKNNKKTGSIPEEKLKGIHYLVLDKANAGYTFEYEGVRYSISADLKSRKIKPVYYQDGALQFKVDVSLRCEIFGLSKNVKIDDEKMEELGLVISDLVKQDIEDSINTSQTKFQCDYLYFYKYFRAKYGSLFKELNWNEVYERAKIEIDVKANVIAGNMKNYK